MSTYEDASLIYYPSGVKAGKAYSLKPTDGSGDLTFTRASTATRVNESGLIESVATGVPRIDFTGGGCGKLLLEPQRSNLALRSEEFNITWATNNSSVSANSTTSPDGTTNADSLIEDTSNNLHQLTQTTTATGGIYTISIYAKANGRNWLVIGIAGAGSYGVFFDIQNGVVGTIQANITSASITSVGNGWYRCVVVGNTGALSPRIALSMSTGNNIFSYLGDGTSGAYFYGGQIELGSYSTSLINTTSTAVTRVADSASKTGISSLIGQTEGVIFYEIAGLANEALNRDFYIWDGTYNNFFRVRLSSFSNVIAADILNGGVSQASFFIGGQTQTNLNKIAIKYKLNEFSLFINGVKVGTDVSGTPPLTNAIFWGNGIKMQNFMIFKTALADAELIALTTL